MCLKIVPLLYMLWTHNIAWPKVCSLFLNISKRGKGVETRNFPNSSFSHNFCYWLSKKIWKVWSVVFYNWLFSMTLKACSYSLRHYDISLNKIWSPKKQSKYLGKWGKIFIFDIYFQVKTNYEHYKEDYSRRFIVH